MAEKFKFKGKTIEELKAMSVNQVAELFGSRQRRTLKRNSEKLKLLLKKIEKSEKPVKTHLRDLIVMPQMVGKIIRIHNGKEFFPVTITEEMIGHYLGEFALTRKRVAHSAPGVGATRSTAFISVK